jgi:hypothetical protein
MIRPKASDGFLSTVVQPTRDHADADDTDVERHQPGDDVCPEAAPAEAGA